MKDFEMEAVGHVIGGAQLEAIDAAALAIGGLIFHLKQRGVIDGKDLSALYQNRSAKGDLPPLTVNLFDRLSALAAE